MAFLPSTFAAESPDVEVYAREPVQNNYIAPPDPDTQWRPGTQPLDTLPTQWWNYFNNLYTKQINTTNKYLKQVISEIAACVGTTIDDSESVQLKTAIDSKIDAIKEQLELLTQDMYDDSIVPSAVAASAATGSAQAVARADHVHNIGAGAITARSMFTTGALAAGQAYDAELSTKQANAGIVATQTSIPDSATNEDSYVVPTVAAVRSFASGLAGSIKVAHYTGTLTSTSLTLGRIVGTCALFGVLKLNVLTNGARLGFGLSLTSGGSWTIDMASWSNEYAYVFRLNYTPSVAALSMQTANGVITRYLVLTKAHVTGTNSNVNAEVWFAYI